MANAACADFHRSLAELDLGQLALLAGLPQAPSAYDPLLHPNLARARRASVLDAMRNRRRTRDQAAVVHLDERRPRDVAAPGDAHCEQGEDRGSSVAVPGLGSAARRSAAESSRSWPQIDGRPGVSSGGAAP
jgi:hypothetical protein